MIRQSKVFHIAVLVCNLLPFILSMFTGWRLTSAMKSAVKKKKKAAQWIARWGLQVWCDGGMVPKKEGRQVAALVAVHAA